MLSKNPITWTLCGLVLILGLALGVVAVMSGIDPAIVVGLITTILGVLVPSPLPTPDSNNEL